MFNFQFILPDDKGRLPSRMFFSSLHRMGIQIDKYLLPNEWVLTPPELLLYCQSMEFDLLSYVKDGGKKNEDYIYARDIINILKAWSNKGHVIRVL